MIDGSVLQSAQKCFEKKSRVVVKMVVKTFVRQNLKRLRAREQNMYEWRQEPCQFRDITDKVSLV